MNDFVLVFLDCKVETNLGKEECEESGLADDLIIAANAFAALCGLAACTLRVFNTGLCTMPPGIRSREGIIVAANPEPWKYI